RAAVARRLPGAAHRVGGARARRRARPDPVGGPGCHQSRAGCRDGAPDRVLALPRAQPRHRAPAVHAARVRGGGARRAAAGDALKHLLAAAVAGVATGMRATTGIGALVETASPGLPSVLTGPPARIGAGVAIAGELVGDKLPNTPSRLDPPGLLARVVL